MLNLHIVQHFHLVKQKNMPALNNAGHKKHLIYKRDGQEDVKGR